MHLRVAPKTAQVSFQLAVYLPLVAGVSFFRLAVFLYMPAGWTDHRILQAFSFYFTSTVPAEYLPLVAGVTGLNNSGILDWRK